MTEVKHRDVFSIALHPALLRRRRTASVWASADQLDFL